MLDYGSKYIVTERYYGSYSSVAFEVSHWDFFTEKYIDGGELEDAMYDAAVLYSKSLNFDEVEDFLKNSIHSIMKLHKDYTELLGYLDYLTETIMLDSINLFIRFRKSPNFEELISR